MITRRQVKEALELIADYEQQLSNSPDPLMIWQIGCKVRLSRFGIEMQGKPKSKHKGTIIGFIEGAVQKTTDGIVCVKWESVKKPEWMHVSQVEKITKK